MAKCNLLPFFPTYPSFSRRLCSYVFVLIRSSQLHAAEERVKREVEPLTRKTEELVKQLKEVQLVGAFRTLQIFTFARLSIDSYFSFRHFVACVEGQVRVHIALSLRTARTKIIVLYLCTRAVHEACARAECELGSPCKFSKSSLA